MSTVSGKIIHLPILRRMLGLAGPYKSRFALTGILVLALTILAPIRPMLIRVGIDEKVANGDYRGLVIISLWVVAILFLEAFLQFFQTYFANWVAQSITLDLRSNLYRQILAFRSRYFDKTPVGQFVTRLVSDIDGMAAVFSDGILSIIGDLLKLVVVIAVMFYEDWALTFVVLIPIPLLLWATKIFQNSIRSAFNDVRNQVARLNVFVQEHVTGMSVVQIFNREKREKEKFDDINRAHMDANIRSIWAFSIFFPVVEILSAGSIALLLWWGLREVVEGQMTLGLILQFILYIFMLYRPIRQLADRFNVFQMGIVNAERVFKVMDTKAHIADEGKEQRERFAGNIRFEHLWFAYDDENWVLKDISFEVKSGQTVAFVGATGAGKSSVINLLSRFYEFQRGDIFIDDVKISDLSLDSIRRNIAVVLQEVFLFSDSILNNIILNDKNIGLEEVKRAAEKVGADHFIERLPGGYDFDVMERGGMLSVGQRQLLAFIRAYVYNPSILVLDEATSNIDSESEAMIQRAIEKLTEGRTSIVIAHRLSTIQKADKIIVLDQGRIVEMGNHQELLALGGHYKRLYELQFNT